MDDTVNYPLVGGFVLVLGAALVAGVLWLSAGLGNRDAVDEYQAYIVESVSGLNVDAPVKYLGVDVGKVSRIEIDPGDPQRVRLLFRIRRGTPVTRDTVGVLKIQGLTGIAYVEISGGSADAPPLAADGNGAPPTIPFKPSLSARLENVLTNVLANVDRMSNSFNAVFDADNRAALATTLAQSAVLARALAARKDVLVTALDDVARTAHLAALAGERLEPALARIGEGADAVRRMAAQAGEASAQAGRAAQAAAGGVQRLETETLPALARLLAELGDLSRSLQRLSEQTLDAPGSLVAGRAPPLPGPGEDAP